MEKILLTVKRKICLPQVEKICLPRKEKTVYLTGKILLDIQRKEKTVYLTGKILLDIQTPESSRLIEEDGRQFVLSGKRDQCCPALESHFLQDKEIGCRMQYPGNDPE